MEVHQGLTRPRLQFHAHTDNEDLSRLLHPSNGGAATGPATEWEMVLPEGVQLGQPGRTGDRLERSEHDLPAQASTGPFRPEWTPLSYQARSSTQMASRAPMRRIKGTATDPYYGVYPPDVRQVFWPGSYPWQCVGRIFTWTDWGKGGGWTWSGSGVLVGRRHVVTAGHVCPWGSRSWAMKFVPGYWDGAPADGQGAQSWTSDYRGWNTDDTVAAHDMAVLRLYDPIGSWLGWMGTRVYDSGWQGGAYWTLAGYPGSIAGAERPSYQSGIAVLDDDNDGDAKEIEHHGSATPGDSGGPFFGFWKDGPHAIGTTSGGESISGGFLGWGDEDNNIEAGGKALVDLVLWAQANWAG
ncbi:MAG: trypsin-like serine peptidase [Acidimicrobiales bacterium]